MHSPRESRSRGNMEIFNTGHYRYTRILLYYLGMWPFELERSGRYCLYLVLIFSSSFPPCMIYTVMVRGFGMDIVIILLPIAGVFFLGLMNVANTKVNEHLINALFQRIQVDRRGYGAEEEELAIFDKCADAARKLTILVWGTNWLACSLYLLLPFWPKIMNIFTALNASRPLQLIFEIEYFLEEDEYYELLYVHGVIMTLLINTTFIAACSLLLVFTTHMCGLILILNRRLAKLSTGFLCVGKADPPVRDDIALYKWLCDCVKLHSSIFQYFDILNSTFSTTYFFQLLCSIVMIAVTCLQGITASDPLTRVRNLSFTGLMIFVLFSHGVLGQVLINYSLSTRLVIYTDTMWYELSIRSRQLLLFMMCRSANPCRLTAGKFFIASVETFSMALRASVSYLTMFMSLQ